MKITLSTDGGTTFPITVVASTPNDGSEVVTIPDNQTTTACMKVEAIGNIFFDISDVNFTISAPVPVQLSRFTGRALTNNRVLLEWRTTSEINNYGFEIQKSPQQTGPFITIPGSFVPGHGTTLIPQYYQYTDVNATPDARYYRLKQIDLDGTIHYFDPIQVNVLTSVNEKSVPTTFLLSQNYPNPFNPTTIIKYGCHRTNMQNSKCLILLVNALHCW